MRVKTEYECSLGWAKANPELMVALLISIAEKCKADESEQDINFSRDGFLTITLTRKVENASRV